MPFVSASIDAFIVTSILVVVPWTYFTLWRTPASVRAAQTQPQPSTSNPDANGRVNVGTTPTTVFEPPLRRYISVFIALHAVYVLHNLLVRAQQNVNLFTVLNVPLTEPSDAMRARLLHIADVPDLPDALERVLMHLRSFDMRHIYVRFGHNAVAECDHCATFYDYALYALPRPLLEYAREAAVVGVVTIRGSVRGRWRIWGLGALVGCALLEAYLVLTSNVIVAEDAKTAMLHDSLWTVRQLVFLVLPAVLHLLPPTPRKSTPLDSLPELTFLANQTFSRIQLLKYTRGATARAPGIREASSAWWERGWREGEWAREDAEVREMAAKMGLGVEEGGELRVKARAAVESLKVAYQPSPFQ